MDATAEISLALNKSVSDVTLTTSAATSTETFPAFYIRKKSYIIRCSKSSKSAGIFMTQFDQSGCHLLTAEAGKTIKEDETAVSV